MLVVSRLISVTNNTKLGARSRRGEGGSPVQPAIVHSNVYEALGCQRGSVLCSVVHKCWFSIVPTRCQVCANEVPGLCQRGAEFVQCCANKV